jgi:rSAM/selenodomain-associated transferase 1
MRDEEKKKSSLFIPHPSSLIPALIVMVKAPLVGLVKTRLMPPLSANEAARLAACFVQDVVNNAKRVASALIIAYAPASGRGALDKLLNRGDLLWLEQRGADLGERLEQASVRAFDLGFSPLVLLGADSPTLPHAFITSATQSLAAAESDVALGPTEDGGYYLVGLRRPTRGLFQNIDWSSPQAYAQTARNARQLGLRLLELPPWYDVDTFNDLLRLRAELFSDEEARLRAPATYRWLKEGMRDERG